MFYSKGAQNECLSFYRSFSLFIEDARFFVVFRTAIVPQIIWLGRNIKKLELSCRGFVHRYTFLHMFTQKRLASWSRKTIKGSEI